MKTRIIASVASLMLALGTNSGRSNPITWTNTSGGNWSVAANWSPNEVPGPTDDASISSSTVTLSANASASSLTLSGGTLGGTGMLVLAGPLNWSGGFIRGTVQCNGGTFTGNLYLVGGQVLNTGSLDWNNADIYDGAGSVISNALGATINLTANGDGTFNNSGGARTFYNAGQLNVSAGPNPAGISDTFVNTGTVTVNAGTLDLQNGGTNTGTTLVAAIATLQASGGTFSFNTGSALYGTGTNLFSGAIANFNGTYAITNVLAISAGTVNFNGNETLTPARLVMSGGTLGGTGALVLAGPLNWSGGFIRGTVQCNGGTFTGNLYLVGGQVLNTGSLDWNNADIYDGAGSVISNAFGATINLTANGDGTFNYSGGARTFYNAGQLNVSAGPNPAGISDTFVNTGTVTVNAGTLDLQNGGTNTGTTLVAAIAALQASGGTFSFNTGSALYGTGTNLFSGAIANFNGTYAITNVLAISAGTVNFNGNETLTPARLVMSGGTLGGTGALVLAGPLNWSGGFIRGTVQCNGGTFTGADYLVGGQVLNTGTLAWNNADIYDGAGSVISNAFGATINLTANGDGTFNYSGGARTFYNAGQLNVSAGPNPAGISDTFVNTGTVTVNAGTLDLQGSYSLTNGTLNFGLSGATNFGKVNLAGAAALSGTLSASLTGGYIPNSTNSFAVLSYSSENGVFTSTNLPFADAWQVIYGSTMTTLQVLNSRPLWTVAANQSVNELALLTATNGARDIDTPAQILTFGLVSAPSGMALSTNTGLITWTPAQTQSPSTNTVVVSVTDNGTPPLSATNSFTVIVLEVNVAPVLPALSQTNVNVLALLTVTNTATESNIHSTLGYALVNPPTGASIDTNGIFTWAPSLSQGPGTNLITTVVTNSNLYDLLKPSLTATNSFTVIVYAPTLAPIGNYSVNVGQTVSFTASGTDNDSTRTLTFSLGTAPAGASIVPATGLFDWRPPVSSAGSSNTVQVIVTANTAPAASATQRFYVLVNALTPVTLAPVSKTTAQFEMQVTGPIGPDYILQANGALANTNWLDILTNTPAASPFSVTDINVSVFTNRFYRVKLGP